MAIKSGPCAISQIEAAFTAISPIDLRVQGRQSFSILARQPKVNSAAHKLASRFYPQTLESRDNAKRHDP
jgi:hypothetical protein